jgi:excisionase family DNA binding protein
MKELADLISTGEAARLLGCSRQHVVDLCERGVLPFVSAGSHRRVRRVDVTGLMRSELTRDQERSLWLHRVVAGHLALDPQAVLTLAARNLQHLGQVHPRGMTAQWLDQWQKVLDSGEDAVFRSQVYSATKNGRPSWRRSAIIGVRRMRREPRAT